MTTLSYELAKELKDAGFPQVLGMDFIFPDGGVVRGNETLEADPDMAAAPTLSELIEACGEGFSTLLRVRIPMTEERYWDAEGAKGKTLEEAVARLWLALNQKNV
jgi:hypothetical protein